MGEKKKRYSDTSDHNDDESKKPKSDLADPSEDGSKKEKKKHKDKKRKKKEKCKEYKSKEFVNSSNDEDEQPSKTVLAVAPPPPHSEPVSLPQSGSAPLPPSSPAPPSPSTPPPPPQSAPTPPHPPLSVPSLSDKPSQSKSVVPYVRRNLNNNFVAAVNGGNDAVDAVEQDEESPPPILEPIVKFPGQPLIEGLEGKSSAIAAMRKTHSKEGQMAPNFDHIIMMKR